MVDRFVQRSLILSLLACLVASAPIIGQTLPKQCKVWLPEYISNSIQLQSDRTKVQDWQDWVMTKIKNNDFGTVNPHVWKVYSDRANNKTYTLPNETSTYHSILGFMEDVNIAEIRNGFALIYKSINGGEGLLIPKDAKCFGWISIDNLLLWEDCPRTYNKIYQKALVVHDPLKHGAIAENNPSFLSEPDKNTAEIQSAKYLEIYFVMKVEQVNDLKYYLLSRSMSVSNAQTVCGWIPEDIVTTWNQRLLIEPAYFSKVVEKYKSKQIYPCIFYDMDDARQLWTNEAVQNPVWKYNDFGTERMCAYTMRFPVLKEVAADIYSVACIASLHSDMDAGIQDKIEDFVEELRANTETRNIEIAIVTMKDLSLQKRKLKEILKLNNWNDADIDKYITYLKDGGYTAFTGYAPIKTSKSREQLFDFVLFFSQIELEEVIQQLNMLTLPDAVADAQAFQDAIVKLGLAMLDQFDEDEISNMDMDRLLGQIYGIPVPLNLCGFDINKIPNMDKEDLNDYTTAFKNKLEKLKQISANSDYDGCFLKNRTTYYWIPMEDMPGVYDDCEKIKINE